MFNAFFDQHDSHWQQRQDAIMRIEIRDERFEIRQSLERKRRS